jgi:hypothetical protein
MVAKRKTVPDTCLLVKSKHWLKKIKETDNKQKPQGKPKEMPSSLKAVQKKIVETQKTISNFQIYLKQLEVQKELLTEVA